MYFIPLSSQSVKFCLYLWRQYRIVMRFMRLTKDRYDRCIAITMNGCWASHFGGGIHTSDTERKRSPKWNSAISLAHLSFPVVRALDTKLSTALSRGLLFLAGSSLSSNGIIKPRPAVYINYRIVSRSKSASIMSRGTAPYMFARVKSLTVNKVTCGGVI